MNGNNTRKLPVKLSLSQTSKNAMFLFLPFTVFFFYKTREWEGGTGSGRGTGGREEEMGKG
jgi:hypothetical protein